MSLKDGMEDGNVEKGWHDGCGLSSWLHRVIGKDMWLCTKTRMVGSLIHDGRHGEHFERIRELWNADWRYVYVF